MKKDYIFTLVTSVITMAASLGLYKMSSYFFGTLGFAEFALVKRIIAALVPLFALGVCVGLPREVSRVDSTEDNEQKYLFLKYSLLIVLPLSILFFLISITFPNKLALLFFSDASYFHLLLPMALFIFGNLLTALAYAYYRGLDRIGVSNVIQLINMVLVPIVVMIFLSQNVGSFFGISGVIISMTSLTSLWPHLRKYSDWDLVILRGLFSYSIRRVPGDISLQLLFVIPPILIAHMSGIEEAGKVSFGLAVLTMISAPLSPLSVLLLPKSMKLFVQKNFVDLKRIVNKMLRFVIAGYFIVGLSLFFGADLFVNYFLGVDKLTSFVIKGIAIAGIPYSIYVLLP